jgi:cytochrome c peroxidase
MSLNKAPCFYTGLLFIISVCVFLSPAAILLSFPKAFGIASSPTPGLGLCAASGHTCAEGTTVCCRSHLNVYSRSDSLYSSCKLILKMKKLIIIFTAITVIVTGFYCTSQQQTTTEKVKQLYTANLDSFIQKIDGLQKAISKHASAETLQQSFLEARKAYKAVEVFAEYYNPSTAKGINGPALDEVEPDNPEYPAPPTGFQVVEELLFPVYDSSNYQLLVKNVAALKAATTRLTMVNESLQFTDAHIFDAIRLEIFRIETLALAGFDAPVALSTIAEIPATLKNLLAYIKVYKVNKAEKDTAQIDILFEKAIAYANTYNDFNSFNRAEYLTQYLSPLTKKLNQFQEKTGIPYFEEPRPLAASAPTLFEKNIFNPSFYTDAHKDNINEELVVLGKKLFNENKLSVNGTRNCASCHIESKAFTDGLARNNSFDGQKTIKRNTPTILYAALQPALFADTRLNYLEDQAKQVVENPDEMHGNLNKAAAELSKDDAYKAAFQKAFSSNEITADKIQKAIAVYIRTKNNFSSRFDAYMRGDASAMNKDEIKGFNLFMGKAKCGTCHFIPLFNGNVPPVFSKIESEVLGVPAANKAPYMIDVDTGKYAVIKSAPYLHAFKTSTVRNSAVTAPYMHNGVFTTMEEVINFYNKGGGIGLGMNVENQTLPPDQLNLSKEEQQQLIAFIKALNDDGY